MKRTLPLAQVTAPGKTGTEAGFLKDLRAVILPERKWHYVFHVVVVLVALSYWIGSLLKLPEASWAEIIMYRPKGDNQVWPVITALSRLNFGDPTDALNYGKGVAGFHAVVLLPHALAVRLFGWPGYMIADAVLVWAFFVAVTLLLRRNQLGTLASLALASALATGSLQSVAGKAGLALFKLLGTFEVALTDWSFPNLIALNIFDTRIPRPLITEIFVVLILYFLIRVWKRADLLDARTGVALGALLGLLAQGDPYSFSALGLILAAVTTRNMAANRWRIPWKFALGLGLSALVVSSYFLFQISAQNPDAPVRFGLANYPRTRVMPLPGYGPLLRVAVVALFAGIILVATGKSRLGPEAQPATGPEPGSDLNSNRPAHAQGFAYRAADLGDKELAARQSRSVAQFCLILVVAAWLAQPVQLFLLGKGAQVYHYLSFTLPTFYSYAMVLLLIQFALHAKGWFPPPAVPELASPRWARSTLLACLLAGEILLGLEAPLDAIRTPLTARDEQTPWAEVGPRYRAAFRDLDRAFREEPTLKEAMTFATINHEVNFLLTAFHHKRAFLPDNGFTTLSDRELENRLFEVGKICQLHPDRFASFIQNHVVMNYWLGCAKYWFATDHSFAPLTNYSTAQLDQFKKMGKQAPFSLALPPQEIERLTSAYAKATFQESDVSIFPDLVIVTSVLKAQAIVPHPAIYSETYTNEVFSVFSRLHTGGAFSAGLPSPGR